MTTTSPNEREAASVGALLSISDTAWKRFPNRTQLEWLLKERKVVTKRAHQDGVEINDNVFVCSEAAGFSPEQRLTQVLEFLTEHTFERLYAPYAVYATYTDDQLLSTRRALKAVGTELVLCHE